MRCSLTQRARFRSAPPASRRAALRRASSSPRQRRVHVTALLKPAHDTAVTWTQSTEEVIVKVPVAADVRGRDVAFEVHPTRLSLAVGGATLLEGSLADAGQIKADESFWVLEGEGATRHVCITLGKAASGYESWAELLVGDKPDLSVTQRVALDVRVGDRPGRLVVGLYGNLAPKTVANFVALCTGENGAGAVSGKPLHFKGSPFHRIIPGFMAQGGDITNGDGTGGESIYGASFADENFRATHAARGALAMANAGPDTNSSQFYVTFAPAPHLDGRHVVFGAVLAGWETLMLMEAAGTEGGATTAPVTLVDCALLPPGADAQAAVDEVEGAARDAALAMELLQEAAAAKAAAAPAPPGAGEAAGGEAAGEAGGEAGAAAGAAP